MLCKLEHFFVLGESPGSNIYTFPGGRKWSLAFFTRILILPSRANPFLVCSYPRRCLDVNVLQFFLTWVCIIRVADRNISRDFLVDWGEATWTCVFDSYGTIALFISLF